MSDNVMMRGSNGHLDYMVVGCNGPVGLGVKPLAALAKVDGKRVVFFGVRLRSAAYPEENKDLVTKSILDDSWPTVEFNLVDNQRCSVIVGGPIQGEAKTQILADRFSQADVRGKLVTKIIEAVGEHQTVTAEEIDAFLGEAFDPLIKAPEVGDNVVNFADFLGKTKLANDLANGDHVYTNVQESVEEIDEDDSEDGDDDYDDFDENEEDEE